MNFVRFVIVTGLSGAGKSQSIKYMEDMGFYCVDNIPPTLIENFLKICIQAGFKKVALVTDIRGGEMFSQSIDIIKKLKASEYNLEILFLQASDDTLVNRYNLTRRRHPLISSDNTVIEAIREERKTLFEIEKLADNTIDTSNLSPSQLKEQIESIFNDDGSYEGIVTYVESFGFKYGIPIDADLVFDVRFLPNPYYIEELKEHTGNEKCVADYVFSFEETNIFLEKLEDMIEFLLPRYIKEGKNQLVIAIGCTGGKHRSVAIANELYKNLKLNNHNVFLKHREQEKQD